MISFSHSCICTHLEVILVHPVSVGNHTALSIELVGAAGKFFSEMELVDSVRHVELLKCAAQSKKKKETIHK